METILKIINTTSDIAATIVIPLVIFLIGNRISRNLREKEIRARYIELAVDVLKEIPEKHQAPLRGWAIDIINHYSDIPLPDQARATLISERPLTNERLASIQKQFYKGRDIREMKEKLRRAGFYTGPIDDEVSTEFTDAVKKLQKALGIFPDGMYGPATARLIDRFLSQQKTGRG